MRLENWCLVHGEINPYLPPEMQTHVISGNVFGNPKFPGGKLITTSTIIKVENGIAYTQSGSEYELGKVDEQYGVLYPDALKRLQE